MSGKIHHSFCFFIFYVAPVLGNGFHVKGFVGRLLLLSGIFHIKYSDTMLVFVTSNVFMLKINSK